MYKSAQELTNFCRVLLPDLMMTQNLELDTLVGLVFKKHFETLMNAPLKLKVHDQFEELTTLPTNAEDIWIFGYGSLVWKADFPYVQRKRGFITGYQRRFFQHSIDHRGTKLKPGRVVTLLPTGNDLDRVYGVAYRIAADEKQQVLEHLDYREKNGYERRTLLFHEFPEEVGRSFDIIMYVATHENDSYAGKVSQVARIAEEIYTSAGPSGPNRDYLFNLASAMRELFPGVDDDHLYDLEREVRRRIKFEEAKTLEHKLKQKIRKLCEEESAIESLKQFEILRCACKTTGWKEALLAEDIESLDRS